MTSVPSPIFGPNGFIAPAETDILAGVRADINAAFGGGLNPGLSTPQGQIASTSTAVIGDKNASFQYLVNGMDPAYNSGRMQDGIARIYFLTRIAGQPTVQNCVCTGLAKVALDVGVVAEDPDTRLLWLSTLAVTIPVSGTITIPFECQSDGPIAGPVSLRIFQAQFGWDSVTPSGDAVLGRFVESRSQFEDRRRLSTAINSQGMLDSILGAVLAVPGVLDAYVTENDTNAPVTIGGVSVAANSLYVAVLGGNSADVAMAIWSRKAPGCGYTGNTTITVTDPSPQYVPPRPTYAVTYEIPNTVNFAALVVMTNSALVPSNALSLVQAAIVGAFAGTDGGTRAKIGSTIYASRYYGPVALLGSWAQLVDIQIGISGAAASFTASIASTTMTVSAVASGALATGQLLQDIALVMRQGTTIVAQLTGSAGSTGTYTVSISQTVASEAMTATTLVNAVTMHIDQAPSIAVGNIALALV